MDDEVKVNVIKSTPHYIFAEVCLNDGKQTWGLAGIYGDPSRTLNLVIWSEIEASILSTCVLYVILTLSVLQMRS